MKILSFTLLLIFIVNTYSLEKIKIVYDKDLIYTVWDNKDNQNVLKKNYKSAINNAIKDYYNIEKQNMISNKPNIIDNDNLNEFMKSQLDGFEKSNDIKNAIYNNLDNLNDPYDPSALIYDKTDIDTKDNIITYNAITIIPDILIHKILSKDKIKYSIYVQSFATNYNPSDQNILEDSDISFSRVKMFHQKSKKIVNIINTPISDYFDQKSASTILLLLNIKGIAKYNNIKLSPTPIISPSYWYKTNQKILRLIKNGKFNHPAFTATP